MNRFQLVSIVVAILLATGIGVVGDIALTRSANEINTIEQTTVNLYLDDLGRVVVSDPHTGRVIRVWTPPRVIRHYKKPC